MLTPFIRIICLLSWTTVFFMPKNIVKRYFPVTIFSGILTVSVVLIGTIFNFWGTKGSLKNRLINHIMLVLGPFAVGNMWIFRLTYGKFGLYLFTNLLNNLLYGFGLIPLVEKANYVSYVKFKKTHHIVVTMIESLILYGYQKIADKKKLQMTDE